MTPPIIISEQGWLGLFRSIQDVELHLEAIDVRNGEYEAFDSEGRILDLETEKVRRRRFFGLLPLTVEVVRISEKSPKAVDSDRLCALLKAHLINRKCPAEELEEVSLHDLVSILEKTNGVTSFSN